MTNNITPKSHSPLSTWTCTDMQNFTHHTQQRARTIQRLIVWPMLRITTIHLKLSPKISFLVLHLSNAHTQNKIPNAESAQKQISNFTPTTAPILCPFSNYKSRPPPTIYHTLLSLASTRLTVLIPNYHLLFFF